MTNLTVPVRLTMMLLHFPKFKKKSSIIRFLKCLTYIHFRVLYFQILIIHQHFSEFVYVK